MKGKAPEPEPLLLAKGDLGPLMSIASSSSLASTACGLLFEAEFRGIAGPPAVNDRGWREQTRRVSIPALRRRAQKSCAPKSLEPFSSLAAALKSDLSKQASASAGRLNYED